MSKKICRSSSEHEDVAHYCITEFMTHPRVEELISKNEGMKFLSGMIHRSFHSSTSPYHKIYRQKGRVHAQENPIEREDELYDTEVDFLTEAILGVLEEMKLDGKDRWYEAVLFEMWLENSNYSELSRKTKIPRTSISKAVQDCREYVKEELKKRNIDI